MRPSLLGGTESGAVDEGCAWLGCKSGPRLLGGEGGGVSDDSKDMLEMFRKVYVWLKEGDTLYRLCFRNCCTGRSPTCYAEHRVSTPLDSLSPRLAYFPH